jgi:SAM-dependent methyltransferase
VHPLEKKFGEIARAVQPCHDQTPANFPVGFLPSSKARAKREIGLLLYPWKNRLQRGVVEALLRELGVDISQTKRPDIICLGHKGFASEIFLSEIASMVGQPRSVLCFGCGLGTEASMIARFLRPQLVEGIDYFNYERAWSFMRSKIKLRWDVDVTFRQIDLRSKEAMAKLGRFDLIISFAVLEHLHDMEQNFASLRGLLRDGGYFASQWGPMWYSYSGDHIAAELGFDAGFEHVRLSPEQYIEFYKSHPRNRDTVARGEPTWLELGLHNYRRYDEYIGAIQTSFGPIRWLKWQLSPEAFRWRDGRQEDWNQMLERNGDLTALDFVLNGAAVIAGRN